MASPLNDSKHLRNYAGGRIGVILTGIVLGMPMVVEAEKRALWVPNGSFESPSTDFVNIRVDGWLKTARPADYPEGGGFLWDQLAGVFRNTPPGSPDHISNMDGKQALYLFAIPGVGLIKDVTSTDSPDSSANSNFPHRFEIGSRYTLRVGVIGQGGGMLPGVPIDIDLYWRDELGKIHSVSTTRVTNSQALYPNRQQFVDAVVVTPLVQTTDPWAGRPMGIRFLSQVEDAERGGYWDLDNIRLEQELPDLEAPRMTLRVDPTAQSWTITWPGRRGESYDLMESSDLLAWSPVVVGLTANDTSIEHTLPIGKSGHNFMRVFVRRP